jgi:hypothetical protein
MGRKEALLLCTIAYKVLTLIRNVYDCHEEGWDLINVAIKNVNEIAMDLQDRNDW